MTTLPNVHAAFARWLALPGLEQGSPFETIDVALATVVANRMEGDPLWLFLVAPPSGGKTEVIRSLDDVSDVFPLSSLSAQTFASGFEKRGAETSLLPKLDGKTIVMKDFGTVLTMYREKKAEILAQLREIYDGSFAKEWGNGKSLKWNGKVGLLAGVTGIIDREYSLNQILGERFLLYRLKRAPARALARAALAQRQREADQRRALRLVVAEFLDQLPLVPAELPPAITEALAALAEFAALARSPVFFDARGEVELVPEPEAPGRLAKQLALLAQALSSVRHESVVSADTYLTVYQVAHDTMPAQRRLTLDVLLNPPRPEPTTTDVAEATHYPTQTARRHLQELAAVRLIDRLPEGQGRPDRWTASKTLRELQLALLPGSVEAPHLSSHVRESVECSETTVALPSPPCPPLSVDRAPPYTTGRVFPLIETTPSSCRGADSCEVPGCPAHATDESGPDSSGVGLFRVGSR
jgi:hypothetical protein